MAGVVSRAKKRLGYWRVSGASVATGAASISATYLSFTSPHIGITLAAAAATTGAARQFFSDIQTSANARLLGDHLPARPTRPPGTREPERTGEESLRAKGMNTLRLQFMGGPLAASVGALSSDYGYPAVVKALFQQQLKEICGEGHNVESRIKARANPVKEPLTPMAVEIVAEAGGKNPYVPDLVIITPEIPPQQLKKSYEGIETADLQDATGKLRFMKPKEEAGGPLIAIPTYDYSQSPAIPLSLRRKMKKSIGKDGKKLEEFSLDTNKQHSSRKKIIVARGGENLSPEALPEGEKLFRRNRSSENGFDKSIYPTESYQLELARITVQATLRSVVKEIIPQPTDEMLKKISEFEKRGPYSADEVRELRQVLKTKGVSTRRGHVGPGVLSGIGHQEFILGPRPHSRRGVPSSLS